MWIFLYSLSTSLKHWFNDFIVILYGYIIISLESLLFLSIYVISSVFSSSGGAALKISAQYSFRLPAVIFPRPPSNQYIAGTAAAAAAAAKSLQSCPILGDPRDGSPPGSPLPGIFQAGTLEWVAIFFSNAWKWKVKVKTLSRVRLLVTPWSAAHQAPPSMGFSRQECWSGVPLPSSIAGTRVIQRYEMWFICRLFFPDDAPCFLKFIPSISSQSGSSKLYLDAWGIRLVFSTFICLTMSDWWVLSKWRYEEWRMLTHCGSFFQGLNPLYFLSNLIALQIFDNIHTNNDPGGGHGNPGTPEFLSGESRGQRSRVGYSP